MVRAPKIDKNGLMKGAWSEEEDNKLREYITKYGHWNWRELPKYAGLSRCGKSCRLRWMNYLRPNIKIGNYTKEEDDLIIKLHDEVGNKWSAIAKKLPGRSDNEIKNHWHSYLKNRAKENLVILKEESSNGTPHYEVNQDYAADFDYSISSSYSSKSNYSDFDWILDDSFWNDPFLSDVEYMAPLVTEFFTPPSPIVADELYGHMINDGLCFEFAYF